MSKKRLLKLNKLINNFKNIKTKIELININKNNPETLGKKFNTEDFDTFISDLRQKIKADPSLRFKIVSDWVDVQKARSAKALLDLYASRLNIDSITIRATKKQYNEDINTFASGVKWEEVL